MHFFVKFLLIARMAIVERFINDIPICSPNELAVPKLKNLTVTSKKEYLFPCQEPADSVIQFTDLSLDLNIIYCIIMQPWQPPIHFFECWRSFLWCYIFHMFTFTICLVLYLRAASRNEILAAFETCHCVCVILFVPPSPVCIVTVGHQLVCALFLI